MHQSKAPSRASILAASFCRRLNGHCGLGNFITNTYGLIKSRGNFYLLDHQVAHTGGASPTIKVVAGWHSNISWLYWLGGWRRKEGTRYAG
jgi:hypothetical protein